MINPDLICHGNIATLNFVTHFGESKFINHYKKTGNVFRLSYTAINDIIILKSQVKAIWPNYVELHTLTGVKRARYHGELFHGENLYAVERFPLDAKDYNWVALKYIPKDVKCIYINIDVLRGNELVNRLIIDPYFGDKKELWL